MKFRKILILLMTMALILQPTSSRAKSDGEIGISIDGIFIETDVPPEIVNNRTLVPLRGIFEELGATVDWNKETRQAIIKNDQIEVLLATDNADVLLNGRLQHLDAPSMLVNDRIMVPLRFVAEALGHHVEWNAVTRDVIILKNPTPALSEDDGLPMVGNRSTLTSLLKYSHDLHGYVGGRFLVFEGQEAVFEDSVTTNADSSKSEALSPEAEKTTDSSSTNNQVEGVDEGDLVKTDGKHIAVVSGNKVRLIDPDPTNPELNSEITINYSRGSISDLYLSGRYLTIIGSSYVSYGIPDLFRSDEKMIAPPIYNTQNTFVLTYDISKAEAPVIVMDMDFEGAYVSSRLIDDYLYMVTSKTVNYWSIDTMTDYELQPKYADNLNNTTTLVGYDAMKYFPDYVAPSIMMTIGIDFTTFDTDVEAYLGAAETVYATADSLYLAFTHYEYAQQLNTLIYVPNYTKTTSLYKFTLDKGSIEYDVSGSVPGSILNQFSLDEYKEQLRIATTTGEMWDEQNLSKNNLYVMNQKLERIGELTDLAPGERIYSTRFYKDRIYMVTYRQVDPFFVIDASVPSQPTLLGYLKIPGFSTYMHVLDENHVLGFGTETFEEGDFTSTGGMKLSLFDVSNPAVPVESKKEVIGVAGTYSEIQNNHKALMISLNKGLMGFPISVAGKTPYTTDFVGAYIYDLSDSDFNYRGKVSHKDADTTSYNYLNNILRILYIDEYLYSLSEGKMVVSNLDDLSKVSELVFRSTTEHPVPIIEPLK